MRSLLMQYDHDIHSEEISFLAPARKFMISSTFPPMFQVYSLRLLEGSAVSSWCPQDLPSMSSRSAATSRHSSPRDLLKWESPKLVLLYLSVCGSVSQKCTWSETRLYWITLLLLHGLQFGTGHMRIQKRLPCVYAFVHAPKAFLVAVREWY